MTPAETLDLYPTPGTVLMASSLAAQLAKNVSLNASLLVDRSRWKPTQSYLFNPREADQHDLDSIHALAVNAFFRLKTVEPALSEYEEYLLSDAAKMTDRTLQNAETNARLNERLNSFLPLLGPYLLGHRRESLLSGSYGDLGCMSLTSKPCSHSFSRTKSLPTS